MPSSTSNFNPRTWAVYARSFAVLAGILIITSGLVRLHVFDIAFIAPEAMFVQGRPLEALRALDEIADGAKRHPNVIVFGSSRTVRGFDPVAYEDKIREICGLEVRAWNFGFDFMGSTPLTQLEIAKRARAQFEAHGAKWDLAILDLAPFQMTYRVSAGEYGAGQDHWLTALRPRRDMISGLVTEFERNARLLVYSVVYGGSTPNRLTTYYANRLRAPPTWFGAVPKEELPLDPEDAYQIGQIERILALEPRFGFNSDWTAQNRGAYLRVSPIHHTREVIDILDGMSRRTDTKRAIDRFRETMQWRIECCDAQELRLDPTQVAAFEGIIRELRAQAKATIVYRPPENRAWQPTSAGGVIRLEALLETLRTKDSVPIVDLSAHPSFGLQHFSDSTHLRPLGALEMSRLLAQQTASFLCPK